jgi:glutathione S-transferase
MMALELEENYARDAVAGPAGMFFAQVTAEAGPDRSQCVEASRLLNDATAPYEERLQDQDFLMGDHLPVVDVTAAPFVSYAMLPPEAGGANNPLVQFFIDNFRLGEGRDKTRAWVQRVLAYDR